MVSRKITSVDDLSLKEISSIINKALQYQKSVIQKKSSKPKNIFNLFLEASTRTTISFELAAKKLGHNITNVNFEKSSLSKGETFNDTMDTLISMKPDALIIRDKNNFSPHEIYQKHNIPILNAGDGTNEHPTQALLDLCVIKSIFKDKKIRIGICGDIKHSRVAHSNIKLLTKLDHEIHIIAPNYFLDKAELTKINEKLVFHKSLSKLPKLDVIMMLGNTPGAYSLQCKLPVACWQRNVPHRNGHTPKLCYGLGLPTGLLPTHCHRTAAHPIHCHDCHHYRPYHHYCSYNRCRFCH